MKVALAQIESGKDSLSSNIDKHLRFIAEASSHNADIIVFPELSLTGYHPSRAQDNVVQLRGVNLGVFQDCADRHGIIVCVGLPSVASAGLRISMMIYHPDANVESYSKRRIHKDEEQYFVTGERACIIPCCDFQLWPSICYESLLPESFFEAKESNADAFMASVCKTERGMTQARDHYSELARQNEMPIFLVNAAGDSEEGLCGGGSAVWDDKGNMLASLGDREELLVQEYTRK